MNICYPDTTDWACALSPQEIDSMDPIVRERSEMLAWLSLSRLMGYRLSLCPIVVRPCAARCNPGAWITAPVEGGGFQPYIMNGRWYNACGCARPGLCSCTVVQEIVLPGEVSGPVVVTIDGATLDPTAYRIDNGNRLVRQDGQAWPMCQDMNLPDGEEGTFSVSYYNGVGPDAALSFAAGLLAIEWYKACTNKECRLPNGARRVVRQGVSFEVPADMFANGLSGIREVDNIVGVYNPHRLVTPSRVISPDTYRVRARTY